MVEENEHGASERFLPAGMLRAIYLRMLEILDPGRIREFWGALPYRHGGERVPESGLYERLWDPFAPISEAYNQTVLLRLERFLHANGIPMETFCNEAFHRLGGGSNFGSENVMAWIQETLREMHQTDQPRRVVLKVFEMGASMSYPGSWCKELSGYRDAEYWTAFCGFAPNPSFAAVMEYDVGSFGHGMVKNLPSMFSMPAFEETRCLTDGRSPARVFWEETRIESGILYLENEPIGKQIGFHQFIRPYIASESISGLGIPDWKVLLLERSHVCPIRKRTVAHAGTVLGAPLYLFEIKFLLEPWGKSQPPDGNFLNRLIKGLASDNDRTMDGLRPRHDHLVSLASNESILYVDVERKAVVSGGLRIFRGIPNLILRKILEDDADPGTRCYEFRWFKFDAGIFPNPKQSNIELRLRRMKEKLDQVDVGIGFNLPGNGRLEVTVRKKIRMDRTRMDCALVHPTPGKPQCK